MLKKLAPSAVGCLSDINSSRQFKPHQLLPFSSYLLFSVVIYLKELTPISGFRGRVNWSKINMLVLILLPMKPLKSMKHGHVTYVWLTSQTAVRKIIFLLKVAHETMVPFFWLLVIILAGYAIQTWCNHFEP